MDGSNDAIAILALVNLIFRYEKFNPEFSPKNYRDAKISIYYDGSFRNGDTTEITLCDDNTVVFCHKDGIPGHTTVFQHGDWEDYLESLPSKLKKAKNERL